MFYFNLMICILSLAFWLYVLYALWEILHHRAPFVPSPSVTRKLAFKQIIKLLNSNRPKTIIDAGCGNGRLLGQLAKKYPQHRFIGIEYNSMLYNYCQHKYSKLKNIIFLNQDLLTFDYNQADIIYYFGLPKLTMALQEKLLHTTKKIDIIALDATFEKLTLIDKKSFRFWLTHSYLYHYKN